MVESQDIYIPPFVVLSLNIKGLLTQKTCENKMIWLKQTCNKIKNLGIVHLQETNFNNITDARRALMRLGGRILGLSTASTSSKGVVSWVPKCSPIYNLISDVKRSMRGRWALMKIEAPHQIIHLLNIYAPSDCKRSREEFFSIFQEKFEDYSNLIVSGDWNFVESDLDIVTSQGLGECEPHPTALDMLEELNLEDIFRTFEPDAIDITFRHVNGSHQSRLDRFYVQSHMIDECCPIETICAASISDHDMIGLQVGLTDLEPKIKPVDPPFRMSRTLIKRLANRDSKLYKHTVELIDDARIRLDQYREAGIELPSHQIWNELKIRLKEYYSETDLKLKHSNWRKYDRMNKLLKYDPNKSIPQQVADKAKAMNYFKNIQKEKIQNIKQASDFNWIRDGEECSNCSFSMLNLEMLRIKSLTSFPCRGRLRVIMNRTNSLPLKHMLKLLKGEPLNLRH